VKDRLGHFEAVGTLGKLLILNLFFLLKLELVQVISFDLLEVVVAAENHLLSPEA